MIDQKLLDLREKYKSLEGTLDSNKEQEEVARKLILRSTTTDKMKSKLKSDLEKGIFRYEEEVTDDKVASLIEEYYEKEIKAAIKDGRLSKPEDDPEFIKLVDKLDKQEEK